MTITLADDDGDRAQHNYGPGTFVGRDNYGPIQTLDSVTKTALQKLSREAPALADLLTRALRDGVISPDLVRALERATWAINEDVASALWHASERINEDVASSLFHSSERINEDVARRIDFSAEKLEATVKSLNAAVNSLDSTHPTSVPDRLARILEELQTEGERIEYMFTPPPPVFIIDWKVTMKAFGWGTFVGVLVTSIIVYLATH